MKTTPKNELGKKIKTFNEIQKTMKEIWNSLSPSLKKRINVCDQYQKIQAQTAKLNLKMSGGIINEND